MKLIIVCICAISFGCRAQEAKQNEPRTQSIPASSLDEPVGKTRSGRTPTTAPRFSLSLSSSSKSFKIGQPIQIVVTIKNTGTEEIPWSPGYDDVRITVRRGPLEAARTLYHRTLRGEILPGDPVSVTSGSRLTLLIPVNQTKSQTLDLDKLYDIKESGTYAVVAQRYDEASDVFVRSNALTVSIDK